MLIMISKTKKKEKKNSIIYQFVKNTPLSGH